jgi:hypothetical protein
MNKLEMLLQDLKDEIPVELHVDVKNACTVLFDKKIKLQMEIDKPEIHLILLAYIQEIPAGKFREKVLKDALKYNNRYPRTGTLGYIEKKNELCIYDKVLLEGLTGKKLYTRLLDLFDVTALWQKALNANLSCPAEFMEIVPKDVPPFLKK